MSLILFPPEWFATSWSYRKTNWLATFHAVVHVFKMFEFNNLRLCSKNTWGEETVRDRTKISSVICMLIHRQKFIHKFITIMGYWLLFPLPAALVYDPSSILLDIEEYCCCSSGSLILVCLFISFIPPYPLFLTMFTCMHSHHFTS